MSFKREGTDDRWMSLLKRRRVTELITEDIPEDEAVVMKNGRLACLVCSYRPTFDTAEMLGLHRKGKKHLRNEKIFKDEKEEIEELRAKRLAESTGETGFTYRERSSVPSQAFIKTPAYDPRTKKRLKPDQRRTVISLDDATSSSDFLTSTSVPMYKFCDSDSESNHSSLHDFSTSCTDIPLSNSQASLNSDNPKQVLPQTISDYIKLKNFQKRAVDIKPYKTKQSCQVFHTNDNSSVKLQNNIIPKTVSMESYNLPQSQPTEKVKKKKSIVEMTQHTQVKDVEKFKKTQQYIKATSSGWKLDWTGQKWERDPNVEFDSDEEPPELPS